MTLAKQDAAAAALVDAIHGTREGLSDEARAALMRVCAGHERRTIALLSMARAAVLRCHDKTEPVKIGRLAFIKRLMTVFHGRMK